MGKRNLIVLLTILLLVGPGCTTTAAHQQNHQAALNENLYLQEHIRQAHPGDVEAQQHLQVQQAHLETTQEWLGKPDVEVPHDHEVQRRIIKDAKRDTEARGLLTKVWNGVQDQWPWLAILTGIVPLGLKLYGKYKDYKGKYEEHRAAFEPLVRGVEKVKEKVGEEGITDPATINALITEATALASPESREKFKKLLAEAKDAYNQEKEFVAEELSKLKKKGDS